MNRIYLKQNKRNSFWVHDILDDKKLGKVKIKNNKPKFKIKGKFNSKLLETEIILLLNADEKLTFKQVYVDFIQNYCKQWTELSGYKFPYFVEASRLKQCENDMFDRKTWLHPAAKKAWEKMKNAANTENIDIQIISAYRDLEYQKQLIQNKINKGISIEEILKVNTLPGFSEHHTGCAIDIGSEGEAILEAEFDQSQAFKWLINNANKFNFFLTYPKDNNTGIMYEPWHWCYKNK